MLAVFLVQDFTVKYDAFSSLGAELLVFKSLMAVGVCQVRFLVCGGGRVLFLLYSAHVVGCIDGLPQGAHLALLSSASP